MTDGKLQRSGLYASIVEHGAAASVNHGGSGELTAVNGGRRRTRISPDVPRCDLDVGRPRGVALCWRMFSVLNCHERSGGGVDASVLASGRAGRLLILFCHGAAWANCECSDAGEERHHTYVLNGTPPAQHAATLRPPAAVYNLVCLSSIAVLAAPFEPVAAAS